MYLCVHVCTNFALPDGLPVRGVQDPRGHAFPNKVVRDDQHVAVLDQNHGNLQHCSELRGR